MNDRVQLVVFRLEGQRYALPLAAVERIVRAVAVTPLPGAPASVLGAIDDGDRILPVLDLRRRFGLPQREIEPADHFVIARTARRTVALAIDQAETVSAHEAADVVRSDGIAPHLEPFPGVVRLGDGLALIHDLEKFLSLDGERALDAAMRRRHK